TFALEALGIELVDGFGPGRPCREPSVGGDNLDAAEGLSVPGSRRENRRHGIVTELRHRELTRGRLCQSALLFVRHSGVDALVGGIPELRGERAVLLARIA